MIQIVHLGMSGDQTGNLGRTTNLISASNSSRGRGDEESRGTGRSDRWEVGDKRERGVEDAFPVPGLDR